MRHHHYLCIISGRRRRMKTYSRERVVTRDHEAGLDCNNKRVHRFFCFFSFFSIWKLFSRRISWIKTDETKWCRRPVNRPRGTDRVSGENIFNWKMSWHFFFHGALLNIKSPIFPLIECWSKCRFRPKPKIVISFFFKNASSRSECAYRLLQSLLLFLRENWRTQTTFGRRGGNGQGYKTWRIVKSPPKKGFFRHTQHPPL
jgi:hypothetical protein